MKKYTQFSKSLEKINQNMELFEKAIDQNQKEKIDRYINANNYKKVLSELKQIIFNLKKEIKNSNFDDFIYKQNNKDIEIIYNPTIRGILTYLDGKRVEFEYGKEENQQKILNTIYIDGERDPFLDITIQPPFNQIHINNGLPVFMKGLGLGKKVYKKLIKDFGYLSSFKGIKPSIESDLVWDTLADDRELFTFVNDNNIICFWNEVDYDIIIIKLKEFYKIKGQKIFDNDFKKLYNLTDEKIEQIINI